jgi:WD40 repeat protein
MSDSVAHHNFKYDAFISYSRKDTDFARRLQSALSAYRPPKDLPVSQRHLRVFRDESDFQGAEYHASLERSLRDAAKLIVVCSPNAAGSVHVAEEIRRFAEHRGRNNIVALIIAGLPNNEARENQAGLRAFPKALVDLLPIPLANDYRGFDPRADKLQKGRFADAWFKTLADLYEDYGVDRGQIEQREQKRNARSRRLAIGTTSAVIAALVGLSLWALIARQEALRQRDLALSRQLAVQANEEMGRRPRIAFLLGVGAYRTAPTNEARRVLQRAFAAQPKLRAVLSHDRHYPEMKGVAFSLDGKILAAGGRDITLWDVASHKPLVKQLEGDDQGGVRDLAFSPDGKILASAGGYGSIILWDIAHLRALGKPLADRLGTASSVAFSPDGKILASAGSYGNIVLWDVAGQKALGQPLWLNNHPVLDVAFSPDGKTLASAHDDGTVTVWSVASRKPIGQPLIGHKDRVSSVAFSPQGNILASGSDYGGSAILWDAASGKRLGEPLKDGGTVAFSPDGKTLASASRYGTVTLWDVASRKLLGEPLRLHEDSVSSVTFSPDGQTLVSASEDKTIILWDMTSRKSLGERLKGHHIQEFVALETPVSKLKSLATAPEGKPPLANRHPNTKVRDEKVIVAFSPNGKTLGIAEENARVILWDMASGKLLRELLSHKSQIQSLVFSPSGKTLASAGQDNTVTLWDMASGTPIREPIKDGGGTIAFSRDGKTLALALGRPTGALTMWDVANLKPLGDSIPADGEVVSMALSSDGKILALSDTYTFGVTLWDVANRERLAVLRTGNSVFKLAFSPDDKTLVSSSGSLWDVPSQKDLGGLLWSDVLDFQFSPDGKTLASGQKDKSVTLLDLASRKPLGESFKGHQTEVRSVVFSPDGKTLTSASSDGAVIRWDIDVASWLRKACAIANRNLTHREWSLYMGDDVPYQAPCPELPIPDG